MKYFILYRLNKLKYFNNHIIKQSDIIASKNIFGKFDILISIKEKEILNEENKDNCSTRNKEEKEKQPIKKEIINNNEDGNYNDINNENKYKFFCSAKFNLSIAIEEIICDDYNNDIENI